MTLKVTFLKSMIPRLMSSSMASSSPGGQKGRGLSSRGALRSDQPQKAGAGLRALRCGLRLGEPEEVSQVPASFSAKKPHYASPMAMLRRAAGTTPYSRPSPGEGSSDMDAYVGNFKNKFISLDVLIFPHSLDFLSKGFL